MSRRKKSNSNSIAELDRPVKQLDFIAEFGHNLSVRSHSNGLFGPSYPYRAKLEELWVMHAAAFMRGDAQLVQFADSIVNYIDAELKKSSDPKAAQKVRDSAPVWQKLFSETQRIAAGDTAVTQGSWDGSSRVALRAYCDAYKHTHAVSFLSPDTTLCEHNMQAALTEYGKWLLAFKKDPKSILASAKLTCAAVNVGTEMSKIKS